MPSAAISSRWPPQSVLSWKPTEASWGGVWRTAVRDECVFLWKQMKSDCHLCLFIICHLLVHLKIDLRCSVVINRSVVHLLLVALTFLSGCGGGVLNWTALWVAHIGAGDWLHFDESNVEPEPVIGTLLCGFSSLFFLPWLAWSMFFLAHCADDLRKQF